MKFRAADTVYHEPTKETWILAADEDNGEVFPCGWPETIAKASDCKLVERGAGADRKEQLILSSQMSDPFDIRRRRAAEQLAHETNNP